MASLTLLWLASYSNVTSIIVIILCFLAMTIFIGFVSLTWDFNGTNGIATGVAQRNMVKMCNPFVIQLAQEKNKLSDGLHLQLSTLCSSKIFIFWGPKINPFHDFILKTGKHIREVLETPSSDDVSALDAFHMDQLSFPNAGDHTVKLPCPSTVSCDSLGDMPRRRYPISVLTLVTDMFEEEQDSTQTDRENSIIGLITIIHLQDDKVTQSSHILSQFVKTFGVQVYSLQPLYVSSAPELNHCKKRETAAATPDGSEEEKILYDKARQPNGTDTKEHTKETTKKHSSLSTKSSWADDVDKEKVSGSEDETHLKDTHLNETHLNETHLKDTHMNETHLKDTNLNETHLNETHLKDTHLNETHLKDTHLNETHLKDTHLNETHTKSLPECVVCQTRQAKCALLPCRHACVCLGCFKLLDKCPMCRGDIDSYFLLSDEDGEEDENEQEDSLVDLQQHAVRQHFSQLWERFNIRLNTLLGFR